MKNKIFLIIIIILLSIALIYCIVYLYMKIDKKADHGKQIENNTDMGEVKTGLISTVEPFLFTQKNVKLLYEGGPSHWGSRTITFNNMYEPEYGKTVILHVVDESDMKGELPKKEWNQKWEAKHDGSLYIDDILMLKSPIIVGQGWVINDYTPVVNSNKYTAKVKITNIIDSIDDTGLIVKNVTTTLTIDELITVDGNAYTEVREFESGIGLKKFTATEPTISDLTLGYWLFVIQ